MPGPPGSAAVGPLATCEQSTPRSKALFDRAQDVMPLGVSGNGKYHIPYPLYLERAAGSRIWDIDGNEYIDFLMGAGATLFGHSHPAIVSAITAQLSKLSDVFLPTLAEVELAERISSLMPHIERMRFANSGSEAVRNCVRAARAVTGRPVIAKCEGTYHGSDDQVLASVFSTAGSPLKPEAMPESSGIPDTATGDTLVLPFNDSEPAVALIEANADRLAAVVLEPVGFFGLGAIPVTPGYAQAIREVTQRLGILLIFDEVVTGFRVSLSGAPAYLGVTPDLSAFGKALGGGLPLAAFGGSADIMEEVLGFDSFENGHRIFQSGTFTAHPLSVAAASAGLDLLQREGVLEAVDLHGQRFRDGLREAIGERSVSAQVTGVSSIFHIHFTASPPQNRRDIQRADSARLDSFLLGLRQHGVFWPMNHPGVISYAHTAADIDQAVEAAANCLDDERHS